MHSIKQPTVRRWLVAAVLVVTVLWLFAMSANASATSSVATCGPETRTASLPTLSYGASGSCVRYAQELLLAQETMIGTSQPDGQFGPGTLKGVKHFQTWSKVKGGADGVIGQNTWKALRGSYCNPV